MAKLTQLLIQAAFILGSILLTFLYYFVGLPLYLILLLHREAIICSAKWVEPSWIPTSIAGGLLAVDKLNTSKVHCYSMTAEFDKPFDVDQFRTRVADVISGNEYPELKCHIIRWLGISFLKPCAPSALSSVFVVNPTRNVEEVMKVTETAIFQPFEEGHPLLEITIFPNVKADKVLWIIRTHHGLIDALSSLRLLQALADPDPEEEAKFQDTITSTMKKLMPPLPWYSKLWIGLEFLFVTPFQHAYTGIQSLNVNMWTTSGCSGNMVQHRQKFNSNEIRKMAHKLGHNSNTLFSAALVGAIREEMKARGDSVNQDMILSYILPSSNHIAKQFSNHFILTFAKIPLSVTDRADRLLAIEEMFQQMRRPAWILLCDLATKFVGLFGGLLRLQTMPEKSLSGCWTNISLFGLDSRLKILGQALNIVSFNGGPEAKGVPVVFMSTVRTNEIDLYTITHDSIFPNEKGLNNFYSRFENELEMYSKIA